MCPSVFYSTLCRTPRTTSKAMEKTTVCANTLYKRLYSCVLRACVEVISSFFGVCPTVSDKSLTALWSASSPRPATYPRSAFLPLSVPSSSPLLPLDLPLRDPFCFLTPLFLPPSDVILRAGETSVWKECRARRLHMNSYTPCNCCQRVLRQLT